MNRPRHEPLAHLALAAGGETPAPNAGLTMRALPYRAAIILRGDGDDAAFVAAFRAGLGFDLPLKPNRTGGHDDAAALWLGPSEWLVLGRDVRERLNAAMRTCRHALVDNGDGQQIIALSGPRARDVLGKLCPLDLDSPDLTPGRCARSILAGCTMLLRPLPGGVYHVHVGRSFADYAWRLLADAGMEYGVAPGAGD